VTTAVAQVLEAWSAVFSSPVVTELAPERVWEVETAGLAVPIVVLPFVNFALASRPPFQRSVEALRAEGVRVLLGPGGVEPHPPRTGGELIGSYPWHLALEEAEHMLNTAGPHT